jgi:hypothetical protein
MNHAIIIGAALCAISMTTMAWDLLRLTGTYKRLARSPMFDLIALVAAATAFAVVMTAILQAAESFSLGR